MVFAAIAVFALGVFGGMHVENEKDVLRDEQPDVVFEKSVKE